MSSHRSAVTISVCFIQVPVALDAHASPCDVSRFMIREFTFSEEAIAKQRDELQVADTTERELWVYPQTVKYCRTFT